MSARSGTSARTPRRRRRRSGRRRASRAAVARACRCRHRVAARSAGSPRDARPSRAAVARRARAARSCRRAAPRRRDDRAAPWLRSSARRCPASPSSHFCFLGERKLRDRRAFAAHARDARVVALRDVVGDSAAVLGPEPLEHRAHVVGQAIPGVEIDRERARDLAAEADERDVRRDLVQAVRRRARQRS